MKFGVFDQNDLSDRPLNIQYEQRLELAALYDEAGFHCYHMSEHHSTPLSMAPSQSVFLSAVAQRTKRLKLSPLVYLLPIHHPIRLAEEICMLDHLANGRLEFGVGRGASPHELAIFGRDPENAIEIYQEAFQIIQKYFTSDAINHDGKYWQIQDAPVTLKPFQLPQPKMWYAAATPDSVVWPTQNGMNIICGGAVSNVHAITDRFYSELANMSQARRDDALIGVSRYVVVAETDSKAIDIANKAWPKFYDSFYKLWRRRGTEPQRLKLKPLYEQMMENGDAIAGSPETVAQALSEQARSARLNYLVGHFMFGDMPHADATQSVKLFASQVMPKIILESQEWLETEA